MEYMRYSFSIKARKPRIPLKELVEEFGSVKYKSGKLEIGSELGFNPVEILNKITSNDYSISNPFLGPVRNNNKNGNSISDEGDRNTE